MSWVSTALFCLTLREMKRLLQLICHQNRMQSRPTQDRITLVRRWPLAMSDFSVLYAVWRLLSSVGFHLDLATELQAASHIYLEMRQRGQRLLLSCFLSGCSLMSRIKTPPSPLWCLNQPTLTRSTDGEGIGGGKKSEMGKERWRERGKTRRKQKNCALRRKND